MGSNTMGEGDEPGRIIGGMNKATRNKARRPRERAKDNGDNPREE